VASQIEDHAAHGELELVALLVMQLQAMAGELVQLVAGLSIDTLVETASTCASRA
jgi:hypothetical protein